MAISKRYKRCLLPEKTKTASPHWPSKLCNVALFGRTVWVIFVPHCPSGAPLTTPAALTVGMAGLTARSGRT
eukprot:4619577-Amphidinium_carterae.1